MTTAYNSESDTTIIEEILNLISLNHILETRACEQIDAVAVGLLGPRPQAQGYTTADDSPAGGILGAIHQDLLETNYKLSVLVEDLYRLRRKLLPAERVSVG